MLRRLTQPNLWQGADALTRLQLLQGAAEWVLEKCTASLNSDGAVVPLAGEQRQDLIEIVTQMAERGLRTLCLSYTDFPAEGNPADFLEVSHDENLVAMCILGIKVHTLR